MTLKKKTIIIEIPQKHFNAIVKNLESSCEFVQVQVSELKMTVTGLLLFSKDKKVKVVFMPKKELIHE